MLEAVAGRCCGRGSSPVTRFWVLAFFPRGLFTKWQRGLRVQNQRHTHCDCVAHPCDVVLEDGRFRWDPLYLPD